MRFLLFAFVLSFAVVMARPLISYAADAGIGVVVNADAISMSDLNDRMGLVIISARLPNTEDTRNKLAPQVVSSLVEEQLKLQEAERLGIQVPQQEINAGFATIAQQNNLEPAQFKEVLKRSGVNVATMERQIRAQLSWNKVIQKTLRPKVTVTDNDIDNVLQRLRRGIGKTEYLMAEIFLPVEKASQEGQVKGLAEELVQKARAEEGAFFGLAQQFSRAPGAPQGGDLGWVQEGQLVEELDQVMSQMEQGDVSDPVRTLGGYYILSMRDSRVISEENIPSPDEIRTSLGLERLERMQRRHLLDLKSSAFVETRLGE